MEQLKWVVDKLRGELQRSETWFLLGQIVVENFSTPVPPEMQAMGWVYIVGRIIKRIVVVLFRPRPKPGE